MRYCIIILLLYILCIGDKQQYDEPYKPNQQPTPNTMPTLPKKLTPQQLTTLKIIYKFRFITADLLSQYRTTTLPTAKEALSILNKSGYIGRHYDKSYKLLGKGARYFLAAQSIKVLKDQEGLNERVLHARYKDKSANQSLIDSSLGVFKTALDMRTNYPEMFTIFTQYELANYSQFPRPLPSLYLKRIETDQDKPNEYFVEIIDDSPFFVVKKLIDRYVEYYEEGEWQGGAYPQLILQISNASLRKKIAEHVESLIENGYIDEDELRIRVVLASDLATENKRNFLL